MLTIRDVSKLLAIEKIKEENNFFNKLTSTVSHEIMTPLNCIITYARTLFGTSFDAKARIIVNVSQLIKMNLKDLLDKSLLENGKLKPIFEEHNLFQLLQSVVDMMKGQAEMKNVQINFHAEIIKSRYYLLDF